MIIFKSFENFCGFLFFSLVALGIVAILVLIIKELCRHDKFLIVVLGAIITIIALLCGDSTTYDDIDSMTVQERIRSEQMILGW